MSDFIFVVNRQAITADFIPANADLILRRRAVSEDDNGRYLCDPEAPASDNGTYFKNRMFAFFGSRAAALQYLASLANRTALALEAQRLKARDFEGHIYKILDAEGIYYESPTGRKTTRKGS